MKNMETGKTGALKSFLVKFNSHEAHPFLQFIKYGIAGGLASAVHLLVFFLAAWFLFPALTESDPFVRLFAWLGIAAPTPEVADKLRADRVMLNNLVAFVFSNSVAYFVNVVWVFKPGRHSRLNEMALFFMVSGISVAVGTALAGGLVRWTGIETTYAFAANVLASVSINYVARKYFVFKG